MPWPVHFLGEFGVESAAWAPETAPGSADPDHGPGGFLGGVQDGRDVAAIGADQQALAVLALVGWADHDLLDHHADAVFRGLLAGTGLSGHFAAFRGSIGCANITRSPPGNGRTPARTRWPECACYTAGRALAPCFATLNHPRRDGLDYLGGLQMATVMERRIRGRERQEIADELSRARGRRGPVRPAFAPAVQHRRQHLPDGAGGRGHPPFVGGRAGRGRVRRPRGDTGAAAFRWDEPGRPDRQPRHRDGLSAST